mgnify:FL=1
MSRCWSVNIAESYARMSSPWTVKKPRPRREEAQEKCRFLVTLTREFIPPRLESGTLPTVRVLRGQRLESVL